MRSSRPRRVLCLAASALALAAIAAPAHAQAPLAPTLSLDTAFNPPTGITRDGNPGTSTDNPSSVAVDGDRIYVVGESSNDVAIVVRRSNGTPETAFSDDGKRIISIGSNRDAAVDVVVLPDHRVRVLALVTSQTNTSDTDVAILGLLPDGKDDPAFGGGDGLVRFPVGPRRDTPTHMAVDAAGRIAISGFAEDAQNRNNSFVALRADDGSPVTEFDGDGVRLMDRGGNGLADRGMDVAFRPGGGLIAALEVATSANTSVNDFVGILKAFKEDGSDDAFGEGGELRLEVGEPNTSPVALLSYGGRLWVTGATEVGQDTDAFVARVNFDGGGLQFRRYDVRGDRIPASEAVVSIGRDLSVLPGTPPTLGIVGETRYLSRGYWSAIAFNNLDGAIDQMPSGELVIPTDETATLVGLAPGVGYFAVAGTLLDNSDRSIGLAKLLVDAEKTCDLGLEILEPRELIFAGSDPRLKLRVTNIGTRACAGVIQTVAPYALSLAGVPGAISTPVLAPGASYTTEGASLGYGGARRRADVVTFTVSAAGDANPNNDRRAMAAVFNFCDVQLRPSGAAGLMPTEGSRVFEFDVRNLGTVACRRVRVATASGTPASTDPYTLQSGRSVSDELAVRAGRGLRPGQRVALRFRSGADADVDAANDAVTVTPTVVGVGDTDARRPSRRFVRGRARPGRGPASLRRRLAVRRVHVAIRRLGSSCRWLASARTMRLRKVTLRRGQSCSRPVWLRASGTRSWRLRLSRSLPRGRYVLFSRATIAAGFPEASFTARDRNLLRFRVR